MAWLIVSIVYIAHISRALCSLEEQKSGLKLMASLQRVQRKLHSIRSIITKFSDNFCRSNLNVGKLHVRLSDLENCGNHKVYVKDRWARAMNPTLFELRHFRRGLLQVTGARKILTPYFLSRISNFIQDEDNIMSDAVRIATEICVLDQDETPETQTIKQELNKYRSREVSSTIEEATVTPTKEATTATKEATTATKEAAVTDADVPISGTFNEENWMLLPTDGSTTDDTRGGNDGPVTDSNETAPINETYSDIVTDEENLIFPADSYRRVVVDETLHVVTPSRSIEQESQAKLFGWNRKALHGRRRSNLTLNESWMSPGILTIDDTETDYYREWKKRLQLRGKDNGDYNYYVDEYDDGSANNYNISYIENDTLFFNLPLHQELINDTNRFAEDFSGSGCLNCSAEYSISMSADTKSEDEPVVLVEELIIAGDTRDDSSAANNYTSAADDFEYETTNCTDPGECRSRDFPPLGRGQGLP